MTSLLRAPFPWFGGKSRAAQLIWQRLGEVSNYVEPFAGSLAVLLGRPTEPRVETVNDLDAMVANFWRAVQAAPAEVAQHADWPVSEPDLHARHRWLVAQLPAHRERALSDPDYFDVKIAGWWVWGLSQWIGGGWCADYICWGDDKDPEKRRPACTGNTGGMGVHAVSLSGTPSRRRPRLGATGSGGAGTGVFRKSAGQLPRCHGAGGTGTHGPRVEAIREWFAVLQQRLRRVRVCCGDWQRVMGPSVIYGSSSTGIVLDPPYSHSERDCGLYAVESNVSAEVRRWAIEHGDDPRLRIALCGYEGEHDMPPSWGCEAWMPVGGYGLQGSNRARANRLRERVWFSPHCLHPLQGQLVLHGVQGAA